MRGSYSGYMMRMYVAWNSFLRRADPNAVFESHNEERRFGYCIEIPVLIILQQLRILFFSKTWRDGLC
jgi:hypothetical protein